MDTATQRLDSASASSAQSASSAGPPAEVLALPVRATPAPGRVLQLADRTAKRVVDVAVAGTLLVLLFPLILLASLLIVLDSPGGAFFRCERAGFRGRRLQMLKFRKMREGASGRALTTDDDDRFTRIGPWLAKFKLDEVPQLWHVVRGEMSLVGPRPEDPSFVERHGSAYDHILTVRPGITGLSQLAFAEESRILDDDDPLGHYVDRLLPQKVNLDRLYASQRTLLLDLKILIWTVAAVILRRQVAVHRGTGKMNLRKR
jgi:lipopolysaccharide/colanic/teichoic acid biosynthesis glycosyltransferase